MLNAQPACNFRNLKETMGQVGEPPGSSQNNPPSIVLDPTEGAVARRGRIPKDRATFKTESKRQEKTFLPFWNSDGKGIPVPEKMGKDQYEEKEFLSESSVEKNR